MKQYLGHLMMLEGGKGQNVQNGPQKSIKCRKRSFFPQPFFLHIWYLECKKFKCYILDIRYGKKLLLSEKNTFFHFFFHWPNTFIFGNLKPWLDFVQSQILVIKIFPVLEDFGVSCKIQICYPPLKFFWHKYI